MRNHPRWISGRCKSCGKWNCTSNYYETKDTKKTGRQESNINLLDLVLEKAAWDIMERSVELILGDDWLGLNYLLQHVQISGRIETSRGQQRSMLWRRWYFPVALYGCETWAVGEADRRAISAFTVLEKAAWDIMERLHRQLIHSIQYWRSTITNVCRRSGDAENKLPFKAPLKEHVAKKRPKLRSGLKEITSHALNTLSRGLQVTDIDGKVSSHGSQRVSAMTFRTTTTFMRTILLYTKIVASTQSIKWAIYIP